MRFVIRNTGIEFQVCVFGLLAFATVFFGGLLFESVTADYAGITAILFLSVLLFFETMGNYFMVNVTDKKENFVKKHYDFFVFGVDVLSYLGILGAVMFIIPEKNLIPYMIILGLFVLNPFVLYGFKKLRIKLANKFNCIECL